MKFEKIGIIGAGTMGIGIGIDVVLHGMQAVLVDVEETILKKAEEEMAKVIRFAPVLDKSLPKVDLAEAMACLTFTTNLRDVADCDFVVENVPEKWSIKEKVYQELDTICQPDVRFGANTSCISITKIGGATKRPDQIIGMHFMNPSYMKRFIEVIRGFHTTDESIAIALEFLASLGKEATVVNDFPGFVSNRVSHLFMNEAAFLVQDGVAQAKQVDMIFKKCYGHKMGPLETADLIGLDTVVNSLNVLYESYQDPKFRCCPLLLKMVEAGLLGRKSGRGFYTYKK